MVELPQVVLQEAGLSQAVVHRTVELQEEARVLGVTQVALPWVVLFLVGPREAVLFLEVLHAADLVLVVLRVAVLVPEAILLSSNTANGVRSNASRDAR